VFLKFNKTYSGIRTAKTGQSDFVRELTTKHIQLISSHFINKSKL
jgi:hypothetical protein